MDQESFSLSLGERELSSYSDKDDFVGSQGALLLPGFTLKQDLAYLFDQLFHFVHECCLLRIGDSLILYPSGGGKGRLSLKREGEQVSFRLPEDSNWLAGQLPYDKFISQLFAFWEAWKSYAKGRVAGEARKWAWLGDFSKKWEANQQLGSQPERLQGCKVELEALLLDDSDERTARLYPESQLPDELAFGWLYLLELRLSSDGETKLRFRFAPHGVWQHFFEEGLFQMGTPEGFVLFPNAGVDHLRLRLMEGDLVLETLESRILCDAKAFFHALDEAFVALAERFKEKGKKYRGAPKIKEITGLTSGQLQKKIQSLLAKIPAQREDSGQAISYRLMEEPEGGEMPNEPPFSPHGYIEGRLTLSSGGQKIGFPVNLIDWVAGAKRWMDKGGDLTFSPCIDDEIHPEPFLCFRTQGEELRIFIERNGFGQESQEDIWNREGYLGIFDEGPLRVSAAYLKEGIEAWLEDWEQSLTRWKIV